MTTRSRNSLGLALSLALVALAPAAAQAAAPSCSNMAAGVSHNAATPISVDCTGGTNSPVVRIVSGPSNGTLDIDAGDDGTDLWVTYRPFAGYAGDDAFTYRGVSLGSGAGNNDEPSSIRTVSLKVAPGSAPVCANLSQSVPQASPAALRLVCASGGDPITGFAIPSGQGPIHGTLGMTSILSGLLSYTSVNGYAGADKFKYTATSTCGAPSCESNQATYDLTVLNPQQGPQGPAGTPGATGATGAAGQRARRAPSARAAPPARRARTGPRARTAGSSPPRA